MVNWGTNFSHVLFSVWQSLLGISTAMSSDEDQQPNQNGGQTSTSHQDHQMGSEPLDGVGMQENKVETALALELVDSIGLDQPVEDNELIINRKFVAENQSHFPSQNDLHAQNGASPFIKVVTNWMDLADPILAGPRVDSILDENGIPDYTPANPIVPDYTDMPITGYANSEVSLVSEKPTNSVAHGFVFESRITRSKALAESKNNMTLDNRELQRGIAKAQMKRSRTSSDNTFNVEVGEPVHKKMRLSTSKTTKAGATKSLTTKTPNTRCTKLNLTKTKKRSKVSTRRNFKPYINALLKNDANCAGHCISTNAMDCVNAFVNDMFERISDEAMKILERDENVTLTEQEIRTAVKLVAPGELGTHANEYGARALANFNTSMSFDALKSKPKAKVTRK